MPFVGRHDGAVVHPEGVNDDASVACLSCGEPMHVRRSHERDFGSYRGFVPRHFVHNSESCGESDRHMQMKSALLSHYLETIRDLDVSLVEEFGIDDRLFDVPGRLKGRQPDAYILFDRYHERLGQGLFIEAQHMNREKDIEAVTRDYLDLGYSVAWATSEDFEGRTLVREPELIHYWPNVVPNEWLETADANEVRGKVLLIAMSDYRTRVPASYPVAWCTESGQLREAYSSGLEYGFEHRWDELPSTAEQRAEERLQRVPVPEDGEPYVRASFPVVWFADHFERWMRNASVQWRPSDPDPPDGPFEDVQCRECGTYWWLDDWHESCPRCGEAVDIRWNLATGRISADSLP